MAERPKNFWGEEEGMSKKIDRWLVNTALRILSVTDSGANNLRHLELSILGMCEGSIIGHQVCHPSEEANGQLIISRGSSGQMVGYDFKRPSYFPYLNSGSFDVQSYLEYEGKIMGFMPPGIMDKDPDELCDITFADTIGFDAIASLDKPTLEELIDNQLLHPRTHEKAYEAAGIDRHIDGLRARGMSNQIVYQVARKAHLLLRLEPDEGERPPKKAPKLVLERAPGLFAH